MKKRISLVIVLVILLMFAGLMVQTCQSFSYDLTMYGEAGLGWGFSTDMITSPGPTIVLKQDDVVNFTLTSHDGLPHQFFVDYNNDSILQSGEPHSSMFSTSTTFQFMADDLNDTFIYRCSIHPATMYGSLTVNTPPIPESPSFILLSLFMISTLLVAILYRRKRATHVKTLLKARA